MLKDPTDVLSRGAPLLPLLARLTFAAVLLRYFWASALTKLDGGLFSASTGAYAQIFPRYFERVGYDPAALGPWHHLVVLAGTWAEFVLPALIVAGLATRPAALGMLGFVAVQTATDLWGHGALAHPATLGAWFDRAPDGPIKDQRLLWAMCLAVPALLGGGPLSLDRLIFRNGGSARPGVLPPAPEPRPPR